MSKRHAQVNQMRDASSTSPKRASRDVRERLIRSFEVTRSNGSKPSMRPYERMAAGWGMCRAR